jgi:hypothetical protein
VSGARPHARIHLKPAVGRPDLNQRPPDIRRIAGRTLGHESVAAMLGKVAGWLGYRQISRRKLYSALAPSDYFPHFPGLRVKDSSAVRRRAPRA